MTQIIFGPGVTPQLPDLDANFTELYGRSQYQRTSGGQTHFSTTVVFDVSSAAPGFYTSYVGNAAYTAAQFLNNSSATAVGGISCTTTATTFTTTSDYRLKANATPLTGSGAFIDALNPVSFTWISNGAADTGFLAHEFQQVAPQSVVGQKDAVDGSGKPVYQAMEASSPEVMANIIAELQAHRRRLHALDGQ